MGNTSVREKSRHASGEDSGPYMTVNKDYDMFGSSMNETNEFLGGFKGFSAGSNTDLDPMRIRTHSITPGMEMDKKELPTVFKWSEGGKNVYISGSFDNWKSKIPMVKSHGDFYTIINLPEGTHEYKFLVDNSWTCDSNQQMIDNNLGTKNNVMTVRESDFEVFEALAIDSNTTVGIVERGGSPTGEYSQDIPPRHQGLGLHHSGPPILPPHLLQVILNKEIPLHCEPTLLPEPNHVMLNHLYALSIKDGVMVLSATHRYRKKYVTTLLYKPIQ